MKPQFGIEDRVIVPHTKGTVQAIIVMISGIPRVGYAYRLRALTSGGNLLEENFDESVLLEANPTIEEIAAHRDIEREELTSQIRSKILAEQAAQAEARSATWRLARKSKSKSNKRK